MPWARLDDKSNDDAKLNALSSDAYRLWVRGLVFCQKNLTDGFIPSSQMPTLLVFARERDRKRVIAELLESRSYLSKGPLWHEVDGGYRIHDFLQWNQSREQVELERLTAKQRMALFQNPELRQQIRSRDGDRCRYCGRVVRWNDRKGEHGGTYDHVQPYGGNTVANLVVCCRGCNSSKRGRTPEQAGMRLLDAPAKESQTVSRFDLDISSSELASIFESQQASTIHVPENPEKQERASAHPLPVENRERLDRLNAAIRQQRRQRSKETDDGRPATKVITALARDVLRQHPDESDDLELRELLKSACVRANLHYDSTSIGVAVETARAQIRRTS